MCETERKAVDRALEATMPSYKATIAMPVRDNGEPLMPVIESPFLEINLDRAEMLAVTGERIYVRHSVVSRLSRAALNLSRLSNGDRVGSRLQICYGWRSPENQQRNFSKALDRNRDLVPPEQLYETAHRQVAVPAAAGHVTGGAVDVQAVGANGKPWDFGPAIYDYSRGSDNYMGSPYLSNRQRENRCLLMAAMLSAGFVAYTGEWWHYNFGDPEWAVVTAVPAAIYGPIEFQRSPRGAI